MIHGISSGQISPYKQTVFQVSLGAALSAMQCGDFQDWGTEYSKGQSNLHIPFTPSIHKACECQGFCHFFPGWNYISQIAIEPNGVCWFRTSSGLLKYNDGTWNSFTVMNGVSLSSLRGGICRCSGQNLDTEKRHHVSARTRYLAGILY